MATKDSKPGSIWTLLNKRSSAFVAARDEGRVTRIYRLYVLNGHPVGNFVDKPDRARIALENAIAGVAEGVHDIPEARGAVADCEWRMQCAQRALEKARER
jgi:hypothetical protein